MSRVAVWVEVMVAAFGRWQVIGCGLDERLDTGLSVVRKWCVAPLSAIAV